MFKCIDMFLSGTMVSYYVHLSFTKESAINLMRMDFFVNQFDQKQDHLLALGFEIVYSWHRRQHPTIRLIHPRGIHIPYQIRDNLQIHILRDNRLQNLLRNYHKAPLYANPSPCS